MIKVKLLTESQAIDLKGKDYFNSKKFNPIEDNTGKWIITLTEANECNNPLFSWVKDLPEIEFVQKTYNTTE